MAHNPLLGSRISLISKKSIRYEGTLYSINEQDATVALQNVRAYGTEGRENETSADANADANANDADKIAFVPAQDQLHPYLLFRGCDIKDLHVHESTSAKGDDGEAVPEDPAIVSSAKPPDLKEDTTNNDDDDDDDDAGKDKDKDKDKNKDKNKNKEDAPAPRTKPAKQSQERKTEYVDSTSNAHVPTTAAGAGAGRSRPRRRNKNTNPNASASNPHPHPNSRPSAPKHMAGSGASLLNRKARGVVEDSNGKYGR